MRISLFLEKTEKKFQNHCKALSMLYRFHFKTGALGAPARCARRSPVSIQGPAAPGFETGLVRAREQEPG